MAELQAVDIAKMLGQLTSTYGGNNPTFLDQYRNSQFGQTWLDARRPDMSEQDYALYSSQMGSSMGSAALGGLSATLTGLTGIAGMAGENASLAETPQYDSAINNMRNVGTGNYYSFNDINNEYNRMGQIDTSVDYDEIRGGSTGQRIGNTLNSTVTGAMTGLTVGGPWGALAGAVVGLGSGIGSWIAGNVRAKEKERQYKFDAKLATEDATRNLNAASERVNNYQFRNGVSHRVAEGGDIQRSSNRFGGNGKQYVRVIRQHCKGGVMVRIK